MAEHVKTCPDCRAERECKPAEAIITAYSNEVLLDALPKMAVKRMRPKEWRRYHTNYMREWRKKKKA